MSELQWFVAVPQTPPPAVTCGDLKDWMGLPVVGCFGLASRVEIGFHWAYPQGTVFVIMSTILKARSARSGGAGLGACFPAVAGRSCRRRGHLW